MSANCDSSLNNLPPSKEHAEDTNGRLSAVPFEPLLSGLFSFLGEFCVFSMFLCEAIYSLLCILICLPFHNAK